jgi:pyruvate/2-oxoglutarate dehydrogenase complex dihydrolipoamide acyltransferase (E2) component
MHAVVVPDLGLPEVAIVVSVWLVPLGAHVLPGDRIVELLAGDATVDLAAPVSGVFLQRHVLEDEQVVPGQVLGLIKSRAP